MLVAFLCFVCLVVAVVGQSYPSQMVLLGSVEDPILLMRWRLNVTDVAIELQAKTLGWIAFGRSPDGQMDKSDIVFAWVDPNGASYAQDRFIIADENSRTVNLTLDHIQDWRLQGSQQNATHTTVRVVRKLVTRDPTDYNFTDPVFNIIYSISDSPPNRNTGEIKMHSFRGTRQFSWARPDVSGQSYNTSIASNPALTLVSDATTTPISTSTTTTSTTAARTMAARTMATRTMATRTMVPRTTTPAALIVTSSSPDYLPLPQTLPPATYAPAIYQPATTLGGTFTRILTSTGTFARPTVPVVYYQTTTIRPRYVWIPATTMPAMTTAPALVQVPSSDIHDPGLNNYVQSTLSTHGASDERSGMSQTDSPHNIQNWDLGSTGIPSSNFFPSGTDEQGTRRPIGNVLDSLAAGSVVVVGHPINNDPPAFDYQGTINSNPDGSTYSSPDYPTDGLISSTSADPDITDGHGDSSHVSSGLSDNQGTDITHQSDISSSGNAQQVPNFPRNPLNLVSLSAEGTNLTANIFGIPIGLGLPQSAIAYLNTPINTFTDNNGVATKVLAAIEQVWSIIGQLVTGRPIPPNNATVT